MVSFSGRKGKKELDTRLYFSVSHQTNCLGDAAAYMSSQMLEKQPSEAFVKII